MTSLDDFAFAKLDQLTARSVKWTLTETDPLAALEVIESEDVSVTLPLKRARLAEAVSRLVPAAI